MRYSRYAVYYTLPDTPLDRFGAAWLGWNAKTGERSGPPEPEIEGLPKPAHDLTATPRKYGLHGTIKPPFRLAEGTDTASLRKALAALCARHPAVEMTALQLTRLGSFLALTPTGNTEALQALAGRVVERLDRFRAPLTEDELARRRKARLSERQEENLARWGYPYVMEDFRFHMTLTGRLSAEELEQTRVVLLPQIATYLEAPFCIDALTLCGEDEDGRFHELHRYALAG